MRDAIPRQRPGRRAATLLAVAHMALGLALRLVSRAKVSAARVVPPFLVVLFLASSAFGAAPETCGDGVDNSAATGGTPAGTAGSCPALHVSEDTRFGTGCDLACTDGDADKDGAPDSEDPDDNNKRVYDGVYWPCDAGGGANSGYKLANNSNGFGSCVSNATPLCEATGGAKCYYVSPATGNDTANNCETYATPCATLGRLSGGATGAPGGAITVTANSFIYLMGATDHTTTFTNGGTDYHFGSSVNGITIKRYPGATARISMNANDCGLYVLGDDVTIDDLSFVGTATPLDAGIRSDGASSENLTVSRTFCDNMGGSSFNNFACIYIGGGSGHVIRNNSFRDIYASTAPPGDITNTSSWKIFPSTPGGYLIENNNYWWTRTTNSSCAVTDKCSQCGRIKHGTAEGSTSVSTIRNEICVWPNIGYTIDSTNVHIENSRIIQPNSFAVAANDEETDSSGIGGLRLEGITVVGGPLFNFQYNFDSAGTDITFQKNIVIDDTATYNVDTGILRLGPYMSDAKYTALLAEATIEDNCYDNTAVANANIRWNFAMDNTTHTLGGNYTFANWQALGFDGASTVRDVTLNAQQVSSDTECEDFGYTATLAPGPTPTPTPTPTPSPSPTPTPIQNSDGRGNVFAQ